MSKNESEEFQVMSPEQTAEMEEFIPDFNGMTIWVKSLECEYCQKLLESKVVVFKWSGPELRFMCPDCFHRMWKKVR